MRSLAKPGLFWMARIALVLSVVAWGVGQYWTCGLTLGIFNTTAIIDLSSPGLIMRLSTFRAVPWQIEATKSPTDDQVDFTRYAFDEGIFPAVGIGGGMAQNKGFGYVYTNNEFVRILAIRHWLIVTIFALFFGLLKWAYRKREGVPDESDPRG